MTIVVLEGLDATGKTTFAEGVMREYPETVYLNFFHKNESLREQVKSRTHRLFDVFDQLERIYWTALDESNKGNLVLLERFIAGVLYYEKLSVTEVNGASTMASCINHTIFFHTYNHEGLDTLSPNHWQNCRHIENTNYFNTAVSLGLLFKKCPRRTRKVTSQLALLKLPYRNRYLYEHSVSSIFPE